MRYRKIALTPIGFVETSLTDEEIHQHHMFAPEERKNVSKLILAESFTHALNEIENNSHIFVIYWMHKIKGPQSLSKTVAGKTGRGVFATRSPRRPNPVGLSVVELLSREGRVLYVKGLDAFDGSPILDIKPYNQWDIVWKPRIPPKL